MSLEKLEALHPRRGIRTFAAVAAFSCLIRMFRIIGLGDAFLLDKHAAGMAFVLSCDLISTRPN